uniref:Uncharacterized protein n=1 Tax=Timema poppense TaxID=170557 RepID=A0A7R9CSQ7_TIMPO|nr:unnamed protein product [Timema poppensis]
MFSNNSPPPRSPSYLVTGALPDGQWWRFLYCSLLNFLSLLVCLIGATMFAKTSVVILAIVCMCLLSAIISFLIEDPKESLFFLPMFFGLGYLGLCTCVGAASVSRSLLSRPGVLVVAGSIESVAGSTAVGVRVMGPGFNSPIVRSLKFIIAVTSPSPAIVPLRLFILLHSLPKQNRTQSQHELILKYTDPSFVLC